MTGAYISSFFKLRLGASIARSVGRSVGPTKSLMGLGVGVGGVGIGGVGVVGVWVGGFWLWRRVWMSIGQR